MNDWAGSTGLDVQTIMNCARSGAESSIPRLYRAGRASLTWSALPSVDGGVFASLEEQPVWSARVTFVPGNQRGEAWCDVRVYERGDHRDVVLDRSHTIGLGARSKNLAEGVVKSLTASDSRLRPI